MWSGGGSKYSFRQQHIAGERNFFSLATAIAPLLDPDGQKEIEDVLIPSHLEAAEQAINDVYRTKLGLMEWTNAAAILFSDMDALMEHTEVDYTMFWRQLSLYPAMFLPVVTSGEPPSPATAGTETETETGAFTDLHSDESLLLPLADVFYRSLLPEERAQWATLIRRWLVLQHTQLLACAHRENDETAAGLSREALSAQMCRVNPKYVPREWMLVEAYTSAAQGDTAPLEQMQHLFRTPYDEHSAEEEMRFYRKMSVEMLGSGGVTTMT
jgi:uncharacterized protein YdiU (UPF0061 family)